MNPRRLWERIRQGHVQNIDFEDLQRLVRLFGFEMVRQEGSHRIFAHDEIGRLLYLQPRRDGSAKPYQIRQFRSLIREYDLNLKGDNDG